MGVERQGKDCLGTVVMAAHTLSRRDDDVMPAIKMGVFAISSGKGIGHLIQAGMPWQLDFLLGFFLSFFNFLVFLCVVTTHT